MSDYTSEQIAQAISDMQASGASNADIAAAAAAAGVSPSEIAAATGVDVGTINQIFQDSGVTPAPEPTPTPTPAPTPTPVAPAPTPSPAPTAADALNALANGASQDQVMAILQQAAGSGIPTPTLTPQFNHEVSNQTTSAAPDTPLTPIPLTSAPVAPQSNNQVVADLNQYNSQTQNGIKNAGLDSVMNSVVNGGNLSDLVKQGLTPQAIGQYKDASGNMLTAAPNTFMVSNPDGSGGALNYFFTVDPKTGTTAPINNPAQNLTYTPGSPGGVISGLISQAGDIIKTVAPIALDIALIANGVDPVTAGAITGSASAAANGGNLGDIAKGAIVGGASGYAGGAASDAVGAGAPITSGIAGGAAAGATGAALTGQNIVTGAATGGIIGGGAGALGLGDVAQKAVDTNADTADINNALKTFNAANPGASPTAQADFLIHDPDLGSFSTQQISTALGASNPITQAAAVIDQSYALNGQEVTAGQQSAAPVAPAAPAQPAWVQDLAAAYNSAQTTHDWSSVDNIIKSNGLTADQIAQTYNITNPSTLSNIQDIVTNGAGTSLDTVNVTGTSAGTGATTPGVTTPAAPTGTNLNTVTVTAPGGTGVTAPATPPVTPTTIPTLTNVQHAGNYTYYSYSDGSNYIVNPDGTINNLLDQSTVTTLPDGTAPPNTLNTVTVTAPGGTGVTSPSTPPVTPTTIPTLTNVQHAGNYTYYSYSDGSNYIVNPDGTITNLLDQSTVTTLPDGTAPPNLNTVTVTAPGGTGVTAPATPPVTPVVPPVIPSVTVTGKTGTDLVAPPTPPVVPPVIPTVTVTGKTGTDLVAPATPPVVPPVIPTVTVIGSKDPGLTVPATPPVVPPTVVPPTVVPPTVPSVPVTPPVVVPPTTPTTPPTTPTTPPSTVTVPPLQMTGLVNPGLNPGWLVNGANQNFYNTNNPVQNTYYWGAHPYMMNQSDMASYNNVPGAPATPFGLQNLQHAIGYDAQGKPIYPTASAPATQSAKGPGTLQQQLGAAWSAGNYGQVNNLVQQNQITTNQAKSVFGFQPSDFAFAAAHGVNLIQPVAPTTTTT